MAGDDARDVFWQDRWWGKGGIQSSKEYEVVKEKKKNRRCLMLQGTVVCRMIWFSGSIPVCVDILTECTQSHSGGLSSVLDTVCPPSNYSLATLFFFFFSLFLLLLPSHGLHLADDQWQCGEVVGLSGQGSPS